LLALLFLMPLLLTSCDGFALYGDIKGEYTFTKITYTDPNTNPGTVFPWTLEGKAVIDEALSINVKKTPCNTKYETDVTAKIGPPNSIQPPSGDSKTDD